MTLSTAARTARWSTLAAVLLPLTPAVPAQTGFRPLPRLPSHSAARPQPAATAEAEDNEVRAIEAGALQVSVQQEPASPVFVEMDIFGSGLSSADSEAGSGDLTTLRGGWRGRIGRETTEHVIGVELGVEGSFYDFGGDTNVAGSVDDPFNDLYRTHVSVGIETHPDETGLGYFVGFETTLGGEDDVEIFDGVTVAGLAGMRFRKNEDIAISFGLAGLSRLEDDAIVWPFLGFDWKISERWDLSLFGPQVELDYRVNEQWTAYAKADYDLRQYRLNDEGSLEDAAFRDEEIRVGGGAIWSSPAGFSVRAEGGLVAWRELTFRDDGNKLDETEFDPAPYAALSISMRF